MWKKEFEKQVSQINHDLQSVIDETIPTTELLVMNFDGIRLLVDQCEKLALENAKNTNV